MSRLVEVHVDNRIRLPAGLPEKVIAHLQAEFTHSNPQHHRLRKQAERLRDAGLKDKRGRAMFHGLLAKLKEEPDKISTWREESLGFSFPRGGLSRIRDILERFDFELDVFDCRCSGLGPLPPSKHNVTLRDFQQKVCDEVMKVEQGIIRSPARSGKTTALIACIAAAQVPSLVVVHTEPLLEQWIKRLRIELGLSLDDIGILSGKTKRIRPITVGMQQTLWRHAHEYVNQFGLVAADEIHLFASKTFSAVLDVFPARFRIGASASEKRKDGKQFLLYDLLGDPIVDVDIDDLVERGIVLDVEVRFVETGTRVPWWEALPEEVRPMERNRLLEDLVSNQKRNEIIRDVVLSEVAKGEQVLVMSTRREHCTTLRSMISAVDQRGSGLLIGDGNADFQRTLAGLLERSVVAACGTYQAIGTGFDLPRVGVAVLATPIHTNQGLFRQASARPATSAEGKDHATLYVPWDRELFGDAPLRNILRWSRRVVVRHGNAWVDGREYLKRLDEGEPEDAQTRLPLGV